MAQPCSISSYELCRLIKKRNTERKTNSSPLKSNFWGCGLWTSFRAVFLFHLPLHFTFQLFRFDSAFHLFHRKCEHHGGLSHNLPRCFALGHLTSRWRTCAGACAFAGRTSWPNEASNVLNGNHLPLLAHLCTDDASLCQHAGWARGALRHGFAHGNLRRYGSAFTGSRNLPLSL